MNEPYAADTWIYSTLKADATLVALIGGATSPRIYMEQAPQNGAVIWPCVIYNLQSAVDLMWVGPRRVWSDMLYLVRGLDKTESYGGNLLTITERIDAALHAIPNGTTNAYGVIWTCTGEMPFRLPEVRDGQNFKHSGRIYRIRASKGQ